MGRTRETRGEGTTVSTVRGVVLFVVKATWLSLSPLIPYRIPRQALFSQASDPSLPNSSHHKSSPIYIYCLNRLRSFFLDGSPNRRASPIHDGIVRSSISYGAYFDEVAFPSRRDFGSRSSGIGY